MRRCCKRPAVRRRRVIQPVGDGEAGYTVKQGQPHYGYKAHVAVDETTPSFAPSR